MTVTCEVTERQLDQVFTAEIANLPAEPLRQYIRQVLYHSDSIATVEKIVRKIGVTRQHLARLCRVAGLRHEPHWYLSAARLLAAAHLLEATDARVSHVAASLRFGEASDLYAMFERYAGRTLPDLRRDGVMMQMEILYRRALIPIVGSTTSSSIKGSKVPTK